MLNAIKIALVVLACGGVAHVLANGDNRRFTIAFLSITFLVWHLETMIRGSRITVNVGGGRIIYNGEVVHPRPTDE